MSAAEPLDEALRAKLRQAAEADVVAPRPERYAALAASLAREERTLRSRRAKPRALLLGTLAAAAAAALLVWLAPRAHERLTPAPIVCALPVVRALASDDQGGQRLSLGRFGALVAAPGARVAVAASSACSLVLELAQGELAGELNSLKPARVEVRTSHGAVIVRGTRFSVRADQALEVVLLEGRVEIEDGQAHWLEPRHVFRKVGGARRVRPMQSADEQRLMTLLTGRRPARAAAPSPAPAAAQAEPSPDESSTQLLARAERERREGRTQRARVLYGQASVKRDRDAEVALLRWARLELELHELASVQQILARHRQRFARAELGAEAAWLGVLLLRERGERDAARAAARDVISRFPEAPQAEAARDLLEAR